ncbi:splicing factor ESS-2 homolog isoform X1 [Eubalaena glacialis]|uniref:splicing factor ESS-2 homolog isoform X1 n=1 Tax=Eubalaena glacialis TaxID=27606 RepID=UPI002A598D7E|nr:splicing factor ESS-2 homolog isoform X1 [Eubalaena glacialis]
METSGAPVRAVLVPAASGPRRKRAAGETGAPTSRQRVLDEEEYIEGLQTVIQRDFFPDVEKLQAQKEYLEAEENGDLERMRQIAIKFGSALGKMSREPPPPYVTPATFETPEVHTGTGVVGSKARGRGHSLEDGDEPSLLPVTARPVCPQSVVLRCDVARESQAVGRFLSFESPLLFGEATEEEEREPLPSLDVFLSRYTSEDNASFQEIMEVAKEKSRARHSWLYQAEEEFEKRQKDNLALPSAECQAVESGQAGVETWKYKAKNSLMYYPEGVPDEEQLFKKPRQVVHKNTRFLRDPFSQALSRSQLQQAAALNAQHKQGKVGPDGKELIPQESPRVGGFGFIATPSPAPGVNESPLMTWGEVENTPLRVEGSETPYVDRTPGPAFKILEPGRRERLGLKMANEAAAKNRAKKQEALRRATENLASLTPKGLSPAMSPALQRLVSRTASKYTDRALRASYTPSPARSTHLKTPAGGPQTPTSTPAPGSATRTPLSQDPACITDNLLQLPARRKASDFF